MATTENLILLFSLGIFIRSFSYVNSWLDIKKIFLSFCIGIFLLIYLIIRSNLDYDFGIYSLIFVGTYAISYAFLQISKILPDISEQSLLLLSLLSLYIYDINFYRPDILGNTILFILITLTLLTIILGFINYILPDPLKLIFYVFFMILNTSISLSYFSFSILNVFLKPNSGVQFGYYDAFFSGIAFMYLLANCLYIFWLVPIPAKGQSLHERIEQWKDFVAILISKHTDAQMHPLQTILNILFFGGALMVNYFFKFFDNFSLILTLITIIQLSDSIFIKHAELKVVHEEHIVDTTLSK